MGNGVTHSSSFVDACLTSFKSWSVSTFSVGLKSKALRSAEQQQIFKSK